MNPTRIETTTFHGLPALALHAQGASAIVTLFGAHIVSWRSASGREQLYLSPRAVFDGLTAIRGGVPVCFPQFAARGPLTRHGFARLRHWQIAETREHKGTALATLRLEPAAEDWQAKATLELTLLLDAARLDIELAVDNLGEQDLEFTAALHTYLALDDIDEARLSGLRGCGFVDSAAGNAEGSERADALRIIGEVDRIYRNVKGALMLQDGSRCVGIHAENLPDTVVWNPGPERCAGLADMPPAGWREMLCVEAGAILTPTRVAPGENWWGRQSLVDLSMARD